MKQSHPSAKCAARPYPEHQALQGAVTLSPRVLQEPRPQVNSSYFCLLLHPRDAISRAI